MIPRGGTDRTTQPGISKDVTFQPYSILIPSAMRMQCQSQSKDPNEGERGWLCFHILSHSGASLDIWWGVSTSEGTFGEERLLGTIRIILGRGYFRIEYIEREVFHGILGGIK